MAYKSFIKAGSEEIYAALRIVLTADRKVTKGLSIQVETDGPVLCQDT